MFLMHKNKPVMQFNLEDGIYKIVEPNFVPQRMKDAFIESPNTLREMMKNYNVLVDFLSSRVLDLSRSNAKKIYNAYHFSQEQSPENKARIAIACKCVSMNNCYWLKLEDGTEIWEDIDPKHNSLSEIVANILLAGTSLTLSGHLHTPEFTSKGAYAKCWIREDEPYLYKASTKDGQESEIEISASLVLDCFNVPHISYLPAKYEDLRVCKSKNIATDDLDMVSAEDVFIYCQRNHLNFTQYALQIDAENIYKMCIMDYLLSNSDRHIGNWGFYMDNQTGKLIGCHPLYDHNNAFDKEFMKHGGQSQFIQGKSQKEVAQYAMKNCNVENIKPIKKDYFLNNEMYDSFCTCAQAIGLSLQKPKLFASFLKKTEENLEQTENQSEYDTNEEERD